MLCIVKMSGGEIVGWIIATDLSDARRQADATSDPELVAALERLTAAPAPGKHPLTFGWQQYVMLVS